MYFRLTNSTQRIDSHEQQEYVLIAVEPMGNDGPTVETFALQSKMQFSSRES